MELQISLNTFDSELISYFADYKTYAQNSG